MVNDLVGFVAGKVVSFRSEEQIAGELLRCRDLLSTGRPDYFYLTDLVNPQEAYWAHIGIEPEPSEELKAAWDYGTRMHYVARQALSQMDGFAGFEGTLDGAAIGLPGIRGRADFRIAHSFIEFKTTSNQFDDPDQVWQLAPNDVEQLLFYSALWTAERPKHYLIFYNENADGPLRVFRTDISNMGQVRNTMKQRKDALSRAVENKDPSRLRRCRRFDAMCRIREAGHCSCDGLEDWSVSSLKEVTQLARDPEMEKLVIEAWAGAKQKFPRPVFTWDLHVPRRAYGWMTGEKPEEPYVSPGLWVRKALWQSRLLPGVAEAPLSPRIFHPLYFRPSGTFIQRTVTDGDESATRLCPALIRLWDKTYLPQARYAQTKNRLMQLGVLCAMSGKSTGVLIHEAPQTGADVLVHIVEFKDLADIKREVRARVEAIASAVENSDPSALPECPDWLKGLGCSNCLCE